jgi:sulfide dehydrogenase cytochrome subunit
MAVKASACNVDASSIIMRKFSFFALIVISFIGLFSPMIVLAEPSAETLITLTPERQLHTRSLAATCAACHSTNQKNSASNAIFMPLYGMNSTYFISQMLAFKSGERASTVMQRHAKGLSGEEISDLAVYLTALRLRDPQPLPQQKLLKTHPN